MINNTFNRKGKTRNNPLFCFFGPLLPVGVGAPHPVREDRDGETASGMMLVWLVIASNMTSMAMMMTNPPPPFMAPYDTETEIGIAPIISYSIYITFFLLSTGNGFN